MLDGGIRQSQGQGIDKAAKQGTRKPIVRIPDLRRLPAIHRIPFSTVYVLLLALIVVASGWWRAANLDAFGISNDEGTHLMWAKLADEGYPLYSQTRAVQGPFFIGLIQLSFKLMGTRVASGRWMEIGLGLITLLGIGLLARRLRGWMAAWVAAVTLSIAPLFFTFSRIVRGDVAASAFLVLALLSGFAFWRTGRRVWLASSGVLIGASLLVKAISPLAFTLILLLILWRRLGMIHGTHPESGNWEGKSTAESRVSLISSFPVSDLIRDVLIFGLGLILPIALSFAIYDPTSLLDTLVTFRLDLRAASPWNPAANLAEIGAFLERNAALAALAAYGWLSLLLTSVLLPNPGPQLDTWGLARQWYGEAAIMAVWLGVTFLTLISHTPLFTHHLISLLLPMAVLAGVAVADAVRGLRSWQSEDTLRRTWGLTGLVLIGFYLVSLPAWLAVDQRARAETTGGREMDAIELLRTVTAPGDFVISDNQMLPFMANRLSPPPLGDIALVAIQSGRQTTEQLIDLSQAYQVEAVATWSHRLPWLPDYLEWVEENYLIRHVWDDQHILYFGRRISEGQVPNRVDAQVGDSIELLGYYVESKDQESDSEGQVVEAGRVLNVTLYWRAKAALEKDYTVFVQLVGPDGRLIAQHDGQPVHGYLPTGDWSPDEVIPDRHRLSLPDDPPPGRYRLIAGMYILETLERLPVNVTHPQGTDDHVTLTQLEIEDQGLEFRD